MRHIRATLATTERIPAYGGFRLSLQDLETILDELKTGAVETRLSHDSRRPLHVENVKASIERRPDGEYALWVEFDADEDGWAEYEAERDAQGGPGGLSFTLMGTFENLPGRGEPTSVSVVVAADAAHFSDQEIRAAAEALADAGPVKASRFYQFAVAPAALALIQFLVQEGAQIPPGGVRGVVVRRAATAPSRGRDPGCGLAADRGRYRPPGAGAHSSANRPGGCPAGDRGLGGRFERRGRIRMDARRGVAQRPASRDRIAHRSQSRRHPDVLALLSGGYVHRHE
jgi:hypothetical protein